MVEEFIGRDRELTLMARLRARALSGRRQVAVVSGEAGIGKTWFCEHVTADAERDGFDVVWGRCWPHVGVPALWPWPAVLVDLIGASGASLLADDPGAGERVAPERFARFAAVADRLKHVRAGTPTMVVLDDLHNADAGALMLTRFLTGALDRLPLVLLVVCRKGGAGTLLDELVRHATALPLRRFTMAETAALLTAHGQRGDDHRLTAVLHQVTGGMPLCLTHAIRRASGPGPSTVQPAIGDALARLPAPTRRLLALAAVLGAEPTVGEIAALAKQPPTEVTTALAEAADAGLVELAASSCTFHDLVREAAPAQLDTSALLNAHARAAELLAGTGHPESGWHTMRGPLPPGPTPTPRARSPPAVRPLSRCAAASPTNRQPSSWSVRSSSPSTAPPGQNAPSCCWSAPRPCLPAAASPRPGPRSRRPPVPRSSLATPPSWPEPC